MTVVPAAAVTVDEDTQVAIAGISVSDVDAGANGIALVQLTVAHGTLSVSSNAANGLTAAGISGNNSANLTLSGTQTAINATLASLGYQGNPNFNGTDTLSVQTSDGGSPALSNSNSVSINVTAVNDAPSISGIPADTVTISNAVATALADFSVSDVDAANTMLYVTLQPSNGSIGGFTDGTVNGLTVHQMSGMVHLTGTAALINTALAAASFTASAAGTASIAVRVSEVSLDDSAAATSSSAGYRFNVLNTPVLSLSSGQDAYINNAETGVDVEVTFGTLASGDTVQLKQGGSAIGSVHTVSQNEAAAQKISLSICQGRSGSRRQQNHQRRSHAQRRSKHGQQCTHPDARHHSAGYASTGTGQRRKQRSHQCRGHRAQRRSDGHCRTRQQRSPHLYRQRWPFRHQNADRHRHGPGGNAAQP